MRVLMTADAVGGVWGYSLELADALAADGVEVTLAVMGGRLGRSHRRQLASSRVAAVHDSALKLEWMDDPWDDVDRAGDWLLRLADHVAPDVVHLNGYAHATLPWPAPTVVVAHSCVYSWWSAVRHEEPPPEWEEYRRRVRDGLDAARCVVAPSGAMLRELRRWYGFRGGAVIPNGRSTEWIVRAEKEPFVLGAGRVWDDAKNLATLDRAAARLEWPVVIAGEAGGRRVEHAAATGRLPFEELAPLLGRAALFAAPARYEPFGLAALEAGLSGCALVLGDIPSLREVWGDAAVFVDPDDEAELATVVGHLLAEPEVAAAWGERARQRAAGYPIGRTAAAYLDTYRSLLPSFARGNP